MQRVVAELPNRTYVELVRSLFSTLFLTAIMAVSFTATAVYMVARTGDSILAALMAAGIAAAGARIAVLLVHRHALDEEGAPVAVARRIERRFAAAYIGFALIFGLFSARVFAVAETDAHVLITGLLFGYGAGVAAAISLRPLISIPAILVATLPTVAVAALSGRPAYVGTAALLALFLAGGVHSMIRRYRGEVREVTMRRMFGALARRDALTGLANRLSLREDFEHATTRAGPGRLMAVHCLDLDRFKPVNDRHGHPVGDALLKAVAGRIEGLLREGDVAARIGGDEFIVLQTGVGQPGEAEVLAHRIVRALAQPFLCEGLELSIGASVGYAMWPANGADLETLITHADSALYGVKHGGGGGVAAYSPASGQDNRLSA